MKKSPDAFRTISEVADWLGVQTHVLRFWESKFTQVKPVKRAGGRRYYRPSDMQLLGGIKRLLHDDGMTIKGVQKLLREEGINHVSSLSQPLDKNSETKDSKEAEAGVEVAENVVRFQARPEDEAAAEDGTAAAVEPVAEQKQNGEEPSPLPSFLTQPMGTPTPPPAASARVVDAPDPPPEDDIQVSPGALARLVGLGPLSAEQARELSPLLGRLAVLRDRMAAAADG